MLTEYLVQCITPMLTDTYFLTFDTFDGFTGSWSVWPHVVTPQWLIKKKISSNIITLVEKKQKN